MDIRKFIDWLAFHKINVMHWHLSEDQGWRIEIKKHPKLTGVGAWRESTPPYGKRASDDGVRYRGFYTQEQAREIVAYAAARHITLVPEIDNQDRMKSNSPARGGSGFAAHSVESTPISAAPA